MLTPDIDGRKSIYIVSTICQCLGSLGVASARTVPELLTLRVLQAFGSASGLSIGVAVIGDIYRLEERGAASGIFFGVRIVYAQIFKMLISETCAVCPVWSGPRTSGWRLCGSVLLLEVHAARIVHSGSGDIGTRDFLPA